MQAQGNGELEALRSILGPEKVTETFGRIPPGSIIIPRFRSIPFGDLLEKEANEHDCTLINSFKEHRNIANSFIWASLLDGSDGQPALTPKQYTLADIPNLPEGEWFVKGETNSLKNLWFEACFAPTTKDLVRVTGRVLADNVTGSQEIVIKPFQNFRRLATGVTGQPIFHERRVFVLDGTVLSDGFYWSSWVDEIGDVDYDRDVFLGTVNAAVERVKHLARFNVIDFAQYEDGNWGVVEINDGCMSGLSENNPVVLWKNFSEVLNNQKIIMRSKPVQQNNILKR